MEKSAYQRFSFHIAVLNILIKMQILEIKKVLGCLESFNARDIFLEKQIGKAFIGHLGSLGKLIYLNELEKPFFKIIVKGKYTIKGSQYNKAIRVVFSNSNIKENLEQIVTLINGYRE